jgi:hypothetical protein
LIFETVKGRRPSIASWFALTWYPLDHNPKYDAGAAQGFKRGLYRESHANGIDAIPVGGLSIRATKPAHGT